MTMIKSLILGSAAGLVALSGAQAADLPVKAKAVEYVKICSLYGAGFFYIPGTDTCIKLGGYLRVDTTFNGFANATDAVYLPVFAGGDGSLHLTEGFGFRGAFNHNWDPYWSTSLFGGYAAVRYDNTAKAQYCAAYAASNTGAQSVDFSCNPDFNLSQIGVVTRWTPVKNLTFSAEVLYFHLDQKFTGAKILTPVAPKPTAAYNYKDQDTVSLNIRAQRNF